MRTIETIGLGIPEFLFPKPGLDLKKWAVIACDQYTSEPDYWQRVNEFIGDAPSTLNLIYPEIYLQEKDREQRIQRIQAGMRRYLDQGLFEEQEGFVYVERTTNGKTRKGFLACLDLEQYDFQKGARSLIRATEGTILERLPPRMSIRQDAPLELPHIMVLIDDPQNTAIGPLTEHKQQLIKLYDFELMMGSGRLAGYKVADRRLEASIIKSLQTLADPAVFTRTYGLPAGSPVLLYAMGDGNHSLATAKSIWENTKQNAADPKGIMHSRLRYALVEIVNLHDPALQFEPIHRLVFGLAPGRNPLLEFNTFCQSRCRISKLNSFAALKQEVDSQKTGKQKIGAISAHGFDLLEIDQPSFTLPVGNLQAFLDPFMESKAAQAVDYVHGSEALIQIGPKPGHISFYLPALDKGDLFKSVIIEGVLPRKTFSMGAAREKRFYLEARKLTA